eukprot:330597-Chlamydomonas_euryale.AAC.1
MGQGRPEGDSTTVREGLRLPCDQDAHVHAHRAVHRDGEHPGARHHAGTVQHRAVCSAAGSGKGEDQGEGQDEPARPRDSRWR